MGKADNVPIKGQQKRRHPARQWPQQPPTQEPNRKERRQIRQGKGQTRRRFVQMTGQRIDHRRQQNFSRAFFVDQEDIIIALNDGCGPQRGPCFIALKLGIAQIADPEKAANQQQCHAPGD